MFDEALLEGQRIAVERIHVVFEYRGTTGKMVVGPRSRRRYFFRGRGFRLEVDPRDRPYIARMPHLKQVFDEAVL
ncbi:MAG: hypothetical protein C4331_01170 [Meiothermus sp.]